MNEQELLTVEVDNAFITRVSEVSGEVRFAINKDVLSVGNQFKLVSNFKCLNGIYIVGHRRFGLHRDEMSLIYACKRVKEDSTMEENNGKV